MNERQKPVHLTVVPDPAKPVDLEQARAQVIDEVSTETPNPPKRTVEQAVAELRARGIPFRLCNHGTMIKVGHINFFPTTGSVCYESRPKFQQQGLEFFLDVLRKEGLYKG